MNITKHTSTHNTTEFPGRSVSYIVIHYTAGRTSAGGAALANAKYFSSEQAAASADYIVDAAGVVQYNPDPRNRYTWHCGGTKLKSSAGGSLNGICRNANSIGIELCSDFRGAYPFQANSPGFGISAAVRENAAELVRKLMAEYDIPVSRVVRHYDVTGKLCPGVIGWNPESGDTSAWDAFIGSLLHESDTPAPWALDAWKWATRAGILDGTRPGDTLTRQELAVVLYRLHK